MRISEILKTQNQLLDKLCTIKGWVKSKRGNKKIIFLSVSDGSTIESAQLVIKSSESLDINEVDKLKIGSSIIATGKIILTPTGQQSFEIIVTEIQLVKNTTDDFPIQKKKINNETLRQIPHFRHRTNLIHTIMLVRSVLAQEIHNYFSKNNYVYVHTPIITSNDGEGAGEAFYVDSKAKEKFFGSNASLTVTGQLHAEAYANGFLSVYTFGPTFRAENSHTQRHVSEFWMVEPEVAFADLKNIIEITSDFLKVVIKKTIKRLEHEFKYLNSNVDNTLIDRLNAFIDKKIRIVEYREAIKLLIDSNVFSDVDFGIDLSTEHEKYLTEVLYKEPVFLINYPKDIKAFYMHQNDDNQTVAAFDLLVPKIGELVGGSQRENRISKLEKRMKELLIPINDLQWYIDLKKEGNPGSSGFGLGFDRLVMFITGIDNIRDVIPFPRTPNNLMM